MTRRTVAPFFYLLAAVISLNIQAVLGQQSTWTVVVRPDDDIQLTQTGAVTSLRKQHKTKVRGVRKKGAAWEDVFFYSITEPIGQAEGADLHTIYYETEDSAYKDVGDIRNMISVIEYEKQSNGIGVKPILGEFALKYYVEIVTIHSGQDRKITVRKV